MSFAIHQALSDHKYVLGFAGVSPDPFISLKYVFRKSILVDPFGFLSVLFHCCSTELKHKLSPLVIPLLNSFRTPSPVYGDYRNMCAIRLMVEFH